MKTKLELDRNQRYERLLSVLPLAGRIKLERLRYTETDAAFDEVLATLEASYVRCQKRARLRSLHIPLTDQDLEALATGTFEETRPLAIARKWHATSKPLLVVSGTPGTGKSFAAAQMLLEHGGAYARAIDVARLFNASFGREVDERQKLIDCSGLLVLDDLGAERNLEAMQVALFELLDERRRDRRRSIWITNLSRDLFEQRYNDPRLLSRLVQSALWLVHVAEDMRRSAP